MIRESAQLAYKAIPLQQPIQTPYTDIGKILHSDQVAGACRHNVEMATWAKVDFRTWPTLVVCGDQILRGIAVQVANELE